MVSSLIQDTCLSASLSYRIGPKLKMTVESYFLACTCTCLNAATTHGPKKFNKLTCKGFFLSNTFLKGMTEDMLHLPNTWHLQYINTKTAQNFINVSSLHLNSGNDLSWLALRICDPRYFFNYYGYHRLNPCRMGSRLQSEAVATPFMRNSKLLSTRNILLDN